MESAKLKPHLACDAKLELVRFPCIVMPKLDGVRALHINGQFVARTLKPHANIAMNKYFAAFHDLDGELCYGNITEQDLCRNTTSATTTINGPCGSEFDWHLFDDLSAASAVYGRRLESLAKRVAELNEAGYRNLHVIPHTYANDIDELLKHHVAYTEAGYEGTIIRNPYGAYKNGRCTAKEADFVRLKNFSDKEALVLEVLEGESNQNEAQINELGHTFRTSHKENKVPNGMCGKLRCKDVETGKEILVSAGRMTHGERKQFFEQPWLIVGQYVKYKSMDYGIKDAPRFATFQYICVRSKVDMIQGG